MSGYRMRVSEKVFDLLHENARRLGVSPEFLVEALVEDAFLGSSGQRADALGKRPEPATLESATTNAYA